MRLHHIFSAALLLFAFSCAPKTTMIWVEGQPESQGWDRKGTNTIYICNPPKGQDWNIWGAMYNAHTAVDTNQSTAMIKNYAGSYFRIFPTGTEADTLVIKYSDYALRKHSWAPEGFVLQCNGKVTPLRVECRFLPYTDSETLEFEHTPLSVTDMIPALKAVRPAAEGNVSPDAEPSFSVIQGNFPEGWYRISYATDGIKVEAADSAGLLYARQTLSNISRNASGEDVPCMEIEDWPDMGYRGLMLDVARAFLSVDDVKCFLDVMAHYKLNRFQFHLTDDEGWRLEIPGIPELTAFSAFHSLPVKAENGKFVDSDHLAPSYDGCIDPNNLKSNTNGYYTRADFVEILKYAKSLGIKVIPEIDTPGHSRAAIMAMEYRYRTTGKDDYRLIDPNDNGNAESCQMFSTNVMNVAMPQTYSFIEKVVDEITSMYAEAGLKFDEFHIGGDEVADGAWINSPLCKEIGDPLGWTTTAQYKEYYVNRVLDILEPRGIQIGGWQEIGLHLSEASQARLRKSLGFLNAWSTLGNEIETAYKFANQGLPTVICNVQSTYLDMAYDGSKTERGLWWGGNVNEVVSFSLLPYNMYAWERMTDEWVNEDMAAGAKGRTELQYSEFLLGVQAHLWGENIRGMQNAGYMVFPKAVGLFERGWNALPSWQYAKRGDDPAFMADLNKFRTLLVEREFPYYDSVGMPYRAKISRMKAD